MQEVLALKYRPKNFSQLVGQLSVSKSLSHALDSKRLGAAYLFSGLRGSGKTSSARIFAKSMLCENGPTSHPCEVCESCKMANENAHLDIIELDAASKRKIDDIREVIARTKTAPAMSRYKIFIIDEVHMLTKEASNAFLKTLEEPVEHVKFILATTDPLKLPATILSRTQHFRFKPIPMSLVRGHLIKILELEGASFEEEAIDMIARVGAGSLRDSITLLDQAISFTKGNLNAKDLASMLGLIDPAKIDEILNIIIKQDRTGLLGVINELENEDAETIVEQLITNLRDKFLNKDPKFSLIIYERFFRVLSEAKGMLGNGSDPSFSLAMGLFLMMEALNLKSIDEEILKLTKMGEMPSSGLKSSENSPKTEKSLTQNLSSNKAINLEPKIEQKQDSNQNLAIKNEIYERFLTGLYDRDYDLGECFKSSVEFEKFENNTLFVISNATGKNREILRKSSRAIMQVLRAVFNAQTKISISQGGLKSGLKNESLEKHQAQNSSLKAENFTTQNHKNYENLEKPQNSSFENLPPQNFSPNEQKISSKNLEDENLNQQNQTKISTKNELEISQKETKNSADSKIGSFKSDLSTLKNLKKNLVDESSDIKAKSVDILRSLQAENSYKVSEDEKKLNELKKLFGEPKIEDLKAE